MSKNEERMTLTYLGNRDLLRLPKPATATSANCLTRLSLSEPPSRVRSIR